MLGAHLLFRSTTPLTWLAQLSRAARLPPGRGAALCTPASCLPVTALEDRGILCSVRSYLYCNLYPLFIILNELMVALLQIDFLLAAEALAYKIPLTG